MHLDTKCAVQALNRLVKMANIMKSTWPGNKKGTLKILQTNN